MLHDFPKIIHTKSVSSKNKDNVRRRTGNLGNFNQ